MELVQSARGCASFSQLRIGGAQHGGREIDEVVVSEVLLDAAYGLAFALVGEGGEPSVPSRWSWNCWAYSPTVGMMPGLATPIWTKS